MRGVSSGDVVAKAAKLITLFDLAGHERYLRTTVLGMTGALPDYACVVVSANNGVQRMTKEHLGLCLALAVPVFVAVTRTDAANEEVTKHTIATITRILKLPGVRKLPVQVRDMPTALSAARTIAAGRIAPIFPLSSVTGAGLNHLLAFLNLLPPRRDWAAARASPAVEVAIDSTFFVTGVGTVVGGIVTRGVVTTATPLALGPNAQGQFHSVSVRSICIKDTPCESVRAGTSAAFALKKEKRSDIRKGMVLVSPGPAAASTYTFDAEVLVLFHSTTIKTNYQPVVHCRTVRQSASITLLAPVVCLRTGDKSPVRFRFLYRPEYIPIGSKLVFREGRTKGIGTVTHVYHDAMPGIPSPPPPPPMPAPPPEEDDVVVGDAGGASPF